MKEKNKKDILIFVFIFVITLIVYANYINMHYATDTYNIINKGYDGYALSNSFKDGRLIMGIIDTIAYLTQMPINVFVITLTVLSIAISCFAIIVLKNMILELKKSDNKYKEIIAVIISYITIFNFMYVENLYFVESFVMSLSILMFILAIKEIIKKDKLYYLKSLILCIIGTVSYQGTIGIFIVFGLLFTLISNKKNKKQIIKDMSMILSILLISFAINLIQIKLTIKILETQQERLNFVSNIWNYTKYILSNLRYILIDTIVLNSCGLFPKTLMLYYTIGIIVTLMIYEIKYKDENVVVGVLEIIALTILITIAMCVITPGTYDTGRINVPIGTLIGILFIYMFCNSNIFEKNKIFSTILLGLLLTYTCITIVNAISLLQQHKIVNNLEKQQCEGLEKYIEEYEKENNTVITQTRYLKISSKESNKGYFECIPNHSVLTYNGVECNWSSIGAINLYTNRKLENEKLEVNEDIEILKKYLKLKSDGYEDNFVIIDNVLYYTVFI